MSVIQGNLGNQISAAQWTHKVKHRPLRLVLGWGTEVVD